MKKLLIILSSFLVVTVSTSSVISCFSSKKGIILDSKSDYFDTESANIFFEESLLTTVKPTTKTYISTSRFSLSIDDLNAFMKTKNEKWIALTDFDSFFTKYNIIIKRSFSVRFTNGLGAGDRITETNTVLAYNQNNQAQSNWNEKLADSNRGGSVVLDSSVSYTTKDFFIETSLTGELKTNFFDGKAKFSSNFSIISLEIIDKL